MTDKLTFGDPETVEVRLDHEGKPSFFFSSREGWDDLGPELRMAADTYNIGTRITLREPINDH